MGPHGPNECCAIIGHKGNDLTDIGMHSELTNISTEYFDPNKRDFVPSDT